MRTHANKKRMLAVPAAVLARRCRLALLLGSLALVVLVTASVAQAADRIYWDNFQGDTISYANLDGSGGGLLPTGVATVRGPMGMTIDPAAGRLYFVNYGNPAASGTTIGFANLDGSGGGDVNTGGVSVTGPHGIAVDHAANKIYWTNDNNNTIAYASLDGSGGGFLNTGAATVSDPRGLAIDLAGGRIYWANHFGQMISYANLDGSGGGDIPTGSATVIEPEGVALDGAGRIFWGAFSDTAPDKISYANLDGSGGADLPVAGANPDHPHGVAIDPGAGRIYWANFSSATISYANLDGSGGGNLPVPGVPIDTPAMPVLLETPAAEGKPDVKGDPAPNSRLTCKAAWKPDLLASQLFRAPQSVSYHWIENGHPLRGEDSPSLMAHEVAEYSCLVTAENAAGTAFRASDAIGVFKLGRLHRNRRRGTAKLTVKLPGPGRLSLQGKKVVKKRVGVAGASSALARKVKGGHVKLLIKAKGKAKRHLDRTGKVKVKVLVGYQPPDGGKGTQTRVLRLQER